MVKALKIIAIAASLSTLSACVTQNYQNANTPVVENDSTNLEIAMTRISLGLGYLKMGNTTQAKLNLEKAKRFAPDLVQVYTAFAHYYETVGEDALTVSSYEKALSLKPDDADTLNNYGVYLCRQDRLPEAEKQFLRAIAVPSYLLVSQSYENLALCQLKAPNFEKAETYLLKAIDHNPSNSSSLYQMMRLMYAKGDYQAALDFASRFEKATRRFNPDSLALTYKIYQKLNDTRTARNYGSMLVSMFPEAYLSKQYLLNQLAEIEPDELAEKYRLLNSTELVKDSNKRVVKLTPNNKPAIGLDKKRRASQVAKSEIRSVAVPQTKAEEKSTAEIKTQPTQPAKRVVVLSPEPSQREVPEQTTELPSDVKSATETSIVETGDTVADAIALAKAEIAAIDEQLGEEAIVDDTQQTEPFEAAQKVDTDTLATTSEVIEEEAETAESANTTNTTDTTNETLTAEVTLTPEVAETAETVDKSATGENKETFTEEVITTDAIVENKLVSEVASDFGAANEATELAADELVEDNLMVETDATQADIERETSAEVNELGTLVKEEASQSPELIEDNLVSNDVTVESENEEISEYQTLDELPQHIIEKGENLFSVSKRYNIRLSTLIKWNELDDRALVRIGDVIYLADPSELKTQEEQ